jgi:Acyl-protein synthetase, LuxE
VTARELDDAFLALVAAWSKRGEECSEQRFDELALATFAYQIGTNEPYARFARARGFDARRLPAGWRDIPAVPASAFKDAMLATFDVRRAECEFHTSGTTASESGKHYLERAALYDASLLAGFDRFMLGDRAKLRYLNLVPNPRRSKHSSLGYMMGHVSVLRGDGKAGFYVNDDGVDLDGLRAALELAVAEDQSVALAGTAFAFVAALDAFAAARTEFKLPAGSRLMETGGFKGRSRATSRVDLYAALARTFGVPEAAIVAEYGMTELVSQYYDAPDSRERSPRLKVAPPWLRTLVIDAHGREVPTGEIGFLQHVDLGNRSSVVALATEDRGYRSGEGIVLLGRESDAAARGCSLDAEELLARR